MSDKILSEPPWVVEIDGVKFATPEAVVLLLKAVSEERDDLEVDKRALVRFVADVLRRFDCWGAEIEEQFSWEWREGLSPEIRKEIEDA